MKVLVLYTQLAGYFYDCLLALLAETAVKKILVIASAPVSLAPFEFESNENLVIQNLDDLDPLEIAQISIEFSPDLVYISGWSSRSNLKLCRYFKHKGVPVVLGLDNQWTGSFRQWIGKILSPWIIRRSSTHVWVPGIYQYEFARHLGFKRREILFNLYSANVSSFGKDVKLNLIKKEREYPHVLLFAGRLVPEKGIRELLSAFAKLKSATRNDWELWIIGNGPLAQEDSFSKAGVRHLNFVQPKDLPSLFAKCGAFCLPSYFENWGVVIHEAAAAGLPILASDACGATTAFVKHGYNGYVFHSGNQWSLENQLANLLGEPDQVLVQMASRSSEMAKQISPTIWAATLSSLLENPDLVHKSLP